MFFSILDSNADSNPNLYLTPQLNNNFSAYVNHIFPSNDQIDDDFYVMPRQVTHPICDKNTNSENSIQNKNSTIPLESSQIYATPPTFSKNFVTESNLSFDDSQDVPNISLDSVPDLINDTPTTNDIYYSYPEQQVVVVNTFFFLLSSYLILMLKLKAIYQMSLQCNFYTIEMKEKEGINESEKYAINILR